MDFNEKLEKAAETHLDLLVELEEEYPDMGDVREAFKSGVRWLMKQPLADRLNPDEKDRLKVMYSGLREGLACSHEECIYDAIKNIERDFGKGVFENK